MDSQQCSWRSTAFFIFSHVKSEQHFFFLPWIFTRTYFRVKDVVKGGLMERCSGSSVGIILQLSFRIFILQENPYILKQFFLLLISYYLSSVLFMLPITLNCCFIPLCLWFLICCICELVEIFWFIAH